MDLVPSTTKTALQLDILEFGALAEAERYRDLLDPGMSILVTVI